MTARTPLARVAHLVLAGALVIVTAQLVTPAASAATTTTYSVPQASASPVCPGEGCLVGGVSGYVYDGDGTCSSNCAGWPSDPTHATLTFSPTRVFASNTCKMKRGTGTIDVSWPSDPFTPSASGSFTFRARQGRLSVSGQIDSATSGSPLYPSDPIHAFAAYPPSPCVTGTAAVSITFG